MLSRATEEKSPGGQPGSGGEGVQLPEQSRPTADGTVLEFPCEIRTGPWVMSLIALMGKPKDQRAGVPHPRSR